MFFSRSSARRPVALFLMVAGIMMAGFTPAPGHSATITVSAAASLTNAFTELKTLFEKAHPGITVDTNFAASNPLLKQMQEGAPVDVFASADQETMDKAAAANLISTESRRNFATNDLVLITPGAAGSGITKAADLLDDKVKRVAIGNPDSVPAGRYAKAALVREGLWEPLQPKLVQAENVRQALDYVSRGEAEAGFVYATDATTAGRKVHIAATMSGHKPVSYPIAVTTNAADKKAARLFVDFVLSPEGQAVLARYGFGKG